WHPDARRVVITFRGELYVAAAVGAPQKIDGPSHVSLAGFLAHARTLAFVRDGNLWTAEVWSADIAAPRALTTLAAPDVVVEGYAWAPDSRQLAFVERDTRNVPKRLIPDYLTPETTTGNAVRAVPGEPSEGRRLGVIGLADRRLRWMDLGPTAADQIFAYEWAPGSRAIAVDKSDVFVKDRRIVVADASTGKTAEWYRKQNPGNVTAQWSVGWAPNGRGLYALSDR